MNPSHSTMVRNLLLTYREAEEAGLNGQDWYRQSRREARRMSRETGVTLSVAAGIIAALSPRVHWSVNKRMAEQTLNWGSPTEGCLALSRERAERIARGERPLSVLRGAKTRAFYRAIMGNEDAAVIDAWMLRACGWPRDTVSDKQYERCAAALRDAASQAGLGTATFQAIVWTHIRGRAE